MNTIESTRNDLVKKLRALDSAKGRTGSGLFLVEGEKLAEEALAAGWSVAYCLYASEKFASLAEKMAGAEVYSVNEAVLGAVCTTKTPQGIVLALRIPETFPDPATLPFPLLALDGVQDPGNVGTMLRTADAAGFGGALLGAGTADPFSPKVVRGSMGSVFRLPVVVVEDLAGELEGLRSEGWCAAATAMEGEDFFSRAAMPHKRILVIGGEGAGISANVNAACDRKLTLPMAGGAQSLNAAVAAGIMMFDWFREMRT